MSRLTLTNAERVCLHELIPKASVAALLIDPTDPASAKANTREVQAAARSLGLELHVLNASRERDFDAVFANLVQLRVGGLVIGGNSLFVSRQEQLAALAVRTRCRQSSKTASLSRPAGS
jgi:putative ABC transport system substrate-binding protein